MAEEVLQVKRGNPPTVVWHLYRGDTFEGPVLKFVDANDAPLDISNYTFEFEVRRSKNKNSGTPLIANANTEFIKGQSDEAIAAGVAQDEGFVQIDKAYTNIPPGKWDADLRYVDPTTKRDTPLAIKIIAHEDVSNPTAG